METNDKYNAGNAKLSILMSELILECNSMARYAFASGLKVPGQIVNALENNHLSNNSEGDGYLSPDTDNQLSGNSSSNLHRSVNIRHISVIHGQLVDIVAPATPRTILLMETEAAKRHFWRFLGPVPLVQRMMFVAIISLIGLIFVSLSPEVDGNPKNFSLLGNSGLPLLINECFLLSAAAIGASFSALFQANYYIQNGTFDPVYESSYWIRFVLGLLAGIMLATLIPIEPYIKNGEQASSSLQGLGKPLLSLLGGFSASVVYRILNRLTSAVESLVKGDTRSILAAQEQVGRANITEQTINSRLQLLTRLKKLQQQLSINADPSDLRTELDRIQNELITPGTYVDEDEDEEVGIKSIQESGER